MSDIKTLVREAELEPRQLGKLLQLATGQAYEDKRDYGTITPVIINVV